jgi:hypothetical protein
MPVPRLALELLGNEAALVVELLVPEAHVIDQSLADGDTDKLADALHARLGLGPQQLQRLVIQLHLNGDPMHAALALPLA